MRSVASVLWKDLIAVQIYGANTGVGKSIVSTALGRHFRERTTHGIEWRAQYLKPVSTGALSDADDRYVSRYAGIAADCLYQYRQPVSAHIAARADGHIAPDEVLVSKVYARIQQAAMNICKVPGERGVVLVETAGGVLSPGPSGIPQADLYRPLRLPAILVGDHRLGGIAATVSAYESLVIRGYDIDAVVLLEDNQFGNSQYLSSYFAEGKLPVFTLAPIPSVQQLSPEIEKAEMARYYELQSRCAAISNLAKRVIDRHDGRVEDANSMPCKAEQIIWHPFAQHKNRTSDDITALDSAHGDFFQITNTENPPTTTAENSGGNPMLIPAFDGSASWWTQGLGHGNPKLSLAAAYAAGRYGHVMFAGTIHQPALSLANRMLAELENPRLAKAFYTDNGSTGVEVAIKMALRAASVKYQWDDPLDDVGVIGLKGSYHGDTLGAMECSEPSVYNQNVNWYRGRGYWFDYPQVHMRRGVWVVEAPHDMTSQFGPSQSFTDLNEIFALDTRDGSRYRGYIDNVLRRLVHTQGKRFGALIMEPVLLGAGGMIFVDPLFQKTLVEAVRQFPFSDLHHTPKAHEWSGLPVIFDEVFAGLYRLGRYSAASYLQSEPDISVHAKLLTGGLLPLAVTLAGQGIFEAFLGDAKYDALLHGHSYTAHPVGCHVANTALTEMSKVQQNGSLTPFKKSWLGTIAGKGEANSDGPWSMWSKQTVTRLSHHASIDGVIALGSVLAITIKDKSGTGYSSNAAAGLRDLLLLKVTSQCGFRVHSRVLGNVLYLMSSINSHPEQLAAVEDALLVSVETALA